MLRNSLLPFITLIAMQFPILLASAFIVEYMFAWPGLVRLIIDATQFRDFPVNMGIIVLSSVAVIFCNMIADILCAVADPRIHK